MNRDSLQKFNQARLTKQYELFSAPVTYADTSTPAKVYKLLGCYSAITNTKELGNGGFELLHDFMCRIQKFAMPTRPMEEGTLTVTTLSGTVAYRVAEVIDHPWSGEWKLGLRSNT